MTMATPTAVDTWAAALAPPKREDDEAHRERIHAEIEADFEALAGMTRGEAAHVARLIDGGRIRHLTINY